MDDIKNVTETKKETKTVYKVNVNPVPFNAVAEVDVTTTNELGKAINDIFAPVFKDYCGCQIECVFVPEKQQWIVVPRLIFHVLKADAYEGAITAFAPLALQAKDDILGRINRVSQIGLTNGAKVAITDAGKSILEDFVVGNNNKDKFDWTSAYNTQATDTETFIKVFKLDILSLIQTIYGAEDENGAKRYYQITPIRANYSAMQQYKQPTNWTVNILRLNSAAQDERAQLLGFGVQYYDNVPPMVRSANFTK